MEQSIFAATINKTIAVVIRQRQHSFDYLH